MNVSQAALQVRRFCGLARLPTARTVTNWLRRFSHHTLRPLLRLNEEVVLDTLARLQLPRLTLDVDGTVVRTGATVGWAFRGFNPHHRKGTRSDGDGAAELGAAGGD